MIRTLSEFLLSRSVDDHTQPTGWLARLVRSNAKLQQFDEQSRQLDQLLRASAVEQRQSLQLSQSPADTATLTLPASSKTNHQVKRHQTPSRSARWLAGLAAAAVLLLAFSSSWLRSTAPEVHAGEFSQQLTVLPGEVLRLLNNAAKTSQTQLPQLSPLANVTLPNFPTWGEVAANVQAPMRQEVDIWQENWQNLKSQFPSSDLEL